MFVQKEHRFCAIAESLDYQRYALAKVDSRLGSGYGSRNDTLLL